MRREDEIHVFVLGESASHTFQMIWLVFVVGIQEAENVTRSMLQTENEGRELAFVALAHDFHQAMAGIALLKDRGSLIGRTVVDNDDLGWGHRLRERALDRIHDKAAVVMAVDDYGYGRDRTSGTWA